MLRMGIEREETGERRDTDGEIVDESLLGQPVLTDENGAAKGAEPKRDDGDRHEVKHLRVATLEEENFIAVQSCALLTGRLDRAANFVQRPPADDGNRSDDEPTDVVELNEDIEDRQRGEEPEEDRSIPTTESGESIGEAPGVFELAEEALPEKPQGGGGGAQHG